MLRSALALATVVAATLAAAAPAHATKTVCTITVNSQDERAAFRRYLPEKDYRFVELVERGRPDWLASACQQQVKCDVLVISGHFNGKHFFSDQLANSEHLPVAEMERASCSESCPNLFSQLQEVYMFGCDSLNADRIQSVSQEIAGALVNGGQSRSEAERIARSLVDRYAESNRDVMRRVFVGTPAIYGFSSVAPLGAVAGPILSRYLQGAAPGEIGSGKPNRRLLAHFAQHRLTTVPGLRQDEPRAAQRAEVCRFMDDRQSPAQKLAFIHDILGRDAAQARMFFDRIEAELASVDPEVRSSPTYAHALTAIRDDREARDRFLAFSRANPAASTRIRMTNVAQSVGWLSASEHRAEMARVIEDLLAPERNVGVADVDALCRLNDEGRYDDELANVVRSTGTTPGHSAALACLGSDDDRARMLQALASVDERDVVMAEVYFHHRPIANANEVRLVTSAIARIDRPGAQARALNALARQRLPDSDGFDDLARLYASATSSDVQRAIATVFIRTDHRAIATPALVETLRQHRRGGAADDVIEALIRRLERVVAASNVQASR